VREGELRADRTRPSSLCRREAAERGGAGGSYQWGRIGGGGTSAHAAAPCASTHENTASRPTMRFPIGARYNGRESRVHGAPVRRCVPAMQCFEEG
jgi:hypothetical protein